MGARKLGEKEILVARLRWTCHLRAVGSSGLLGIVICGQSLAGLKFPLAPIIFLTAASLLYDAVILLALRVWRRKPFCSETVIYHGIGNIAGSLDVLGLTAMVYFTGGLSSPWVYYPVVGTVTAAALFPWYHALVFTILSGISLSLMFFAEAQGLLQPVTVAGLSSTSLDAGYLATMLLSLVAFMAMSAYMVSFPAAREREYQSRLDMEAKRAKVAARQSRSLLKLLRRLSLLRDAAEVARVLAVHSLELVRCQACAVLRWHGRTGKYEVLSFQERGCCAEGSQFAGLEIGGQTLPEISDGAACCLAGGEIAARSTSNKAGAFWRRFNQCLIVPLGSAEDRVGFLVLGLRESLSRFTRAQQRMAHGIAYEAATALQNAELLSDLRKASELKSQFVANISHELRTPLHIINGYAELMEGGSFGPVRQEQKNACRIVLDSANQLLRIVDATLEINQMDMGVTSLSLERVCLREVWEELRGELPSKQGVALEWRQGQEAQWIVTDKQKLKMILKQLLGNALEFTEKGVVEAVLEVDQGTRSFVIQVRDTGAGIAEENLGDIFDMFRQVDGSLTRHHEGLGLGLYLVKRLVELLGGSIEVQSTSGVGSCFTVRLPLNAEADSGEPIASVSAAG